MDSLTIYPSEINGEVVIPSSKSMIHRCIIAASLSKGESIISNVTKSDDIESTIDGVKAFGAHVIREKNKIRVKGVEYPVKCRSVIDCKESASTLRFLIPIACLIKHKVTFIGRGNLANRPLDIYKQLFDEMELEYKSGKCELPFMVRGPLKSGKYNVKGDVSSQFVTGLLLALPMLNDKSVLTVESPFESKQYVEMTIEILKYFGIEIISEDDANNNRIYKINGNQRYKNFNIEIESDYSQVGYFLVAGILGGYTRCGNFQNKTLQGDSVIVDLIKAFGGTIIKDNNCLIAFKTKTKGIIFNASQNPDLVPIVAVIGALSNGVTQIVGAGRLKIKESDRLNALYVNLSKIGADIKMTNDGLKIYGKKYLDGGEVDSFNDHRIAMALSLASVKCLSPVIINNCSAVSKSYPNYFNDFSKIGAKIIF